MKISQINEAIQSACNLLSTLGCKVSVKNAQGKLFKPMDMRPVDAPVKGAKKIVRTKKFSHVHRDFPGTLKTCLRGSSKTFSLEDTTMGSLQSALSNAAKSTWGNKKHWHTTKDNVKKTVTIHRHAE